MSEISRELISLLQYLLPGFVAAWVFNGLTSYPPLPRFERIVQALILMLFVQAAALGLEAGFRLFDGALASAWLAEGSEVSASLLAAFSIGVAFAWLANTDRMHAALRRTGITRETSYPSEWFGAFHRRPAWVVLHLTDGPRLLGWPTDWPSHPDRGHFLLKFPSWVHADLEGVGQAGPRPEAVASTSGSPGIGAILIEAQEVRWVEFTGTDREIDHEQETIQPPAADGPSNRERRERRQPRGLGSAAPGSPSAAPSSSGAVRAGEEGVGSDF